MHGDPRLRRLPTKLTAAGAASRIRTGLSVLRGATWSHTDGATGMTVLEACDLCARLRALLCAQSVLITVQKSQRATDSSLQHVYTCATPTTRRIHTARGMQAACEALLCCYRPGLVDRNDDSATFNWGRFQAAQDLGSASGDAVPAGLLSWAGCGVGSVWPARRLAQLLL